MNRGGTTTYYHADWLGSITSLTDSKGALNSFSIQASPSTNAKLPQSKAGFWNRLNNRLAFLGCRVRRARKSITRLVSYRPVCCSLP